MIKIFNLFIPLANLIALCNLVFTHSTNDASQAPSEFLATMEDGTCPPCPACECMVKAGEDVITVQVLVYNLPGTVNMMKWNAEDYERYIGGKIKINIRTVDTLPDMYDEISFDAQTGEGAYDAYFTNAVGIGTAVTLNGFFDMTNYVKDSNLADWGDIFLALRAYLAMYENKIYMIPFDGNTHTLYYRKDILQAYNLTLPRTWSEYIEIAEFVHGKEFNGTIVSGSCIPRMKGDHLSFFSHLVLGSITQTNGTITGSIFDTEDMTPLTGEAMVEMLRILESQAKFGVPNGISEDAGNDFVKGECALACFWGAIFRKSLAADTSDISFGVAPTPGSQLVLNRKTGKLEKCTQTLCPFAKWYDDLGWVNQAPYTANGGWGGAISANTKLEKQEALVDFFIWASSKEQSTKYVIPEAGLLSSQINSQDPFRKSHLNLQEWIDKGYDRTLSKSFLKTVRDNLASKNAVVELRWPNSGKIMDILKTHVFAYLMQENNDESSRIKTTETITEEWLKAIKEYDDHSKNSTLEIYQRLRGIYVPQEQKQLISKLRPIGLTVMAFILIAAIAAAIFTYVERESKVVKASQPFFLLIICLGTFIMGFAILPMSVDDSIASTSGASIACMSVWWLAATGFSITFSALFSKIWRLNKLVKHAQRFRKVIVTVYDVLLPFAVLLSLNFLLLSIWSVLDPLLYVREYTGRNEDGDLVSYGHCQAEGKASTVLSALIVVLNACVMILACVQAFQTRNIKIVYQESLYVALNLASMLQAFIVGIPILFLASQNPIANYFVSCFLVTVVCMTTLGFTFLPKLRHRIDSESFRFSIKSGTQRNCKSEIHAETKTETMRSNRRLSL